MPAPSSDTPSPDVLRWTLHPAALHPGGAAALVSLALAAGVAVRAWTGHVLAGALAALVLLVNVRSWLLPRTYVLDALGAREEGWLSGSRPLAWADVLRVTPARGGVLLAARRTSSRLMPERGLFVRTGPGGPSAAAVLAFASQRAAS